MVITFKYKVLPDEFSNGSKKPIVKLTLKGNSKTPIDVIGLLDSGADVSVIPRGLAEFLDLKIGEKEVSKGIGGEINVWNSHFNITVQQNHENYNFKNVPVQVSEDDTMPIIIGRHGFFNKFEIRIDEANECIKLKRKTGRIFRGK